MAAGDLHVGEGIVTLDGAAATVAWVRTVPGQADRYNLTMASDHTYAVGGSLAMHRQTAERCRREIIRLCHAGLNSRTLRIEIIRRLRKVISLDVSFFTTADPATLLFTGAVVDEILERATPQFLENDFLQDDVNKFSWLARSVPPVGSLIQATQRELKRSPRYHDILAPLALGDELRAALMTGGACWGFLCLHRDRFSPQFTSAEAAFLGGLTPHIALGLRKALLLGSATGRQVPDEPGVLVLAEDLSVVAITSATERWLAELAEVDWPHRQAVPYAIFAVVARLRGLERHPEAEAALMPKVRVRTVSGHWLVLHVSRLLSQSMQERIAVTFEVAQPVEKSPISGRHMHNALARSYATQGAGYPARRARWRNRNEAAHPVAVSL